MLIYKSAAAAAWLSSADDDELVLIFPSFHERRVERRVTRRLPESRVVQRVLYFYPQQYSLKTKQ